MKFGPFTFASDFFTSKTTWTILGGIGFLVSQGLSHQMTWQMVAVGSFTALWGLFHRDTTSKASEGTRGALLGILVNSRPKVDLEAAMTAHANVNKGAIANAVAATVAAVLDRYAAEYNEGQEVNAKPAPAPSQEAAKEPVDPNFKPTLTVVPGGTGVDHKADAANAASLNEPHDGEADA